MKTTKQRDSQSMIQEWRRRAEYHLRTGNEYAEESHLWEGEIGDGYSGLAEAHHFLSQAFAKKAEPPDAPRTCVKCGHAGNVDEKGTCYTPLVVGGRGAIGTCGWPCGCKCVVATPTTPEDSQS